MVYSPSSTINYFNDFDGVLNKLCPSYEHVIIMGDLNTCLLKKDFNRSNQLNALTLSFNLNILPLSATHFSPNSNPSLLDLIIVSKPEKVRVHGQLTAPFSYHDLLFLSYNLSIPKRKGKVILRRNFKDMDLISLTDDAAKIDWSPLLSASTVNDKVAFFKSDPYRFI